MTFHIRQYQKVQPFHKLLSWHCTTDVVLPGAGKKQRMSGCKVRERSNGYQAVKCGKEATDIRL
jgi:hypothetical protein